MSLQVHDVQKPNQNSLTEQLSSLDQPGPSGLSRREIEQLKAAGLEKPEFISWPEWLGPKKLSHRQQFICHLAALGYKPREIAKLTGMTESRLSIVLNSPIACEEIQLIRDKTFRSSTYEQNLNRMSAQALRVQEEILFSPNERSALKLRAADSVLDRKFGKAKQSIEVHGSLLRDFYELLQGEKPSEPKEIPIDAEWSLAQSPNVPPAQQNVSTKDQLPAQTTEDILSDDLFESWSKENLKDAP